MNFGVYLRLVRKRAGLTLRALAKKLDCSAAYICDIEHGRRAAPPEALVARMMPHLNLKDETEAATFMGLAIVDRFSRYFSGLWKHAESFLREGGNEDIHPKRGGENGLR
jgi:transcriptional regulator with XRE-family HTH domain